MAGKGPGPGALLLLACCFSGALVLLGQGPAPGGSRRAGAGAANQTVASPPSSADNFTTWTAKPLAGEGGRTQVAILAEIREENDWKNDLVLFWLPAGFRQHLPRPVHSWLRNWIATVALYFGVSGAWAYYIYWCFGLRLFGAGNMPTGKDVGDQIRIALGSMPLYAILPALTEAVVEAGYTRAYSRISDVGLARYWAYFALYMVSVEFFVYWQHRGLHDIKLGYRWLHWIHHKYNKEHSMSPFAGLAFHPLDGILQAIPYCWTLFFVPMHFLTHELLLFATGVWTTNIHDNLHCRVEPIMGAGYHTIHHTAYKFNYGHYTTVMDRWFGTLLTPDEYPRWLKQASQAAPDAAASS